LTLIQNEHIKFMQTALSEAKKAGRKAEVPVGAVLVAENEEILSATHNQTITLNDPSAHAEMLVLREAAAKIGNYRLLNTTLYVTVEPCPMCMGAVIHARIARVVFGARNPKWGAAGSLYNFSAAHRFNHQLQIIEGICVSECKEIMKEFFSSKRG
jgi:tRNA(adenine34) deaminase